MQADAEQLKVFTGRANPQLAQKVCDYLQIPLGRGRTDAASPSRDPWFLPSGPSLLRHNHQVPRRRVHPGTSAS